jgi:hypothetical protein
VDKEENLTNLAAQTTFTEQYADVIGLILVARNLEDPLNPVSVES